MPAKTKQKAAADGTSIFVPREKLSLRYSMKPPTDEQKKVLFDARIFIWPHYYEMGNTEEVREVLRAIDVSWSDHK